MDFKQRRNCGMGQPSSSAMLCGKQGSLRSQVVTAAAVSRFARGHRS